MTTPSLRPRPTADVTLLAHRLEELVRAQDATLRRHIEVLFVWLVLAHGFAVAVIVCAVVPLPNSGGLALPALFAAGGALGALLAGGGTRFLRHAHDRRPSVQDAPRPAEDEAAPATEPMTSEPAFEPTCPPMTISPAPMEARVLLVEDGIDNQRIATAQLERAGARVTLAENGRTGVDAALAAAREGKPFDVIFMDVQMPVMDGLEATSTLRREGYRGAIVALTAHGLEFNREACLRAGCDDFMTKPMERGKLAETALRCARERRAQIESSATVLDADRVTPEAMLTRRPPAFEVAALLTRPPPRPLEREPMLTRPPPRSWESGPPSDVLALADAFEAPLVSELATDPDVADMVADFAKVASSRGEAVAEALAAGDHATVKRLVHQLKGAAGGFGYPSITEQALAVEHALESGSADELRAAVQALRALCVRAGRAVGAATAA